MRVIIAALFFCLCWQPSSNIHASDKIIENTDALKLGIFPRRGEQQTRTIFQPLVDALSDALDRKVVLETAHDFVSFWDKISDQQYDVVHYNQYHYLKSHINFGYRVIAQNVEFGKQGIAGAIVVRNDDSIDSLLDLKGKKIVFGGGRRAMQAYIATTYLLRQAGLKQGDYFEQFALNPPKACIATYYQQAAAAGAGNHVLELEYVKREIDVDKMKYLAVGEEIAHLPWAVKQSISDDLAEKIQDIMVNLHNSEQGREILEAAHITKLVPATDADYNPHRKIIKSVLNENL